MVSELFKIKGNDSAKVDDKPKSMDHLIAGGIAGLVSAISLQPFDLLKTRLQQKTSFGETKSLATELKKVANLKDLWRGALPSAIRTSVGAGLYFSSLSISRNYLASLKMNQSHSSTSALPKLSPLENLGTGFAMRAFVGMITMPVTMIKTRFESNHYSYNSISEGIQGIYNGDKGKSSIKNFFKGSLATLARDCPYAGLYVLFYESFKNDILPSIVPSSIDFGNRSAVINSSAALLAACVSTGITAPFDAIKTRLQLSSSGSTFMQATKSILREKGGISNLFNGLSLRLARKGISSAISWCIYEEIIRNNFLRNFRVV